MCEERTGSIKAREIGHERQMGVKESETDLAREGRRRNRGGRITQSGNRQQRGCESRVAALVCA